jgi:hypothetical protein
MSFSTKSVPLIASCVLASLALAACGGSGSNANASASAQDDERQILNFVKCMREHGVNVSTPNGAGPGPIKVTSTSPQVMEAAQKACQRYRPRGAKENLSPAERAAREDAVNKFAKCMREHGVEVQVPTRGGGAIGIQLKGVDPQSPAFQAAQKACEGYMPKLRRAGRTAGPGPGLGAGPRTESSSPPASGSPAGSSLTLGAGK